MTCKGNNLQLNNGFFYEIVLRKKEVVRW